MSLFDDIAESTGSGASLKPLHTVINKKTKDLLDWLKNTAEALENQATTRHTEHKKNLEAYRGVTNLGKTSHRSRSESQLYLNQTNKFVVNHLHDITETKVSQMCRIKPSVEVLPTNDDYDDKNAASACKSLINHIWNNNDIDDLLRKMQRQCRIFGESYLFIEWDTEKGDLHPAYVQARDMGAVIELMNSQGESQFDDHGVPKQIKKEVRIGDIKYEILPPWKVLLQRKTDFNDVDYCIKVSTVATEDLKKKYPKYSKKFQSDRNLKSVEIEQLTDRVLEDQTLVYELYHKNTELVPGGLYAKFVKEAILDKTPLPYSHGNLPFERLTDIDVPDQLNGASGYDMVRPIQNMHNNLSTLLAKNIYLTGHAKWVMPRGACKIEALGNDSTIVQYQGPVPPQLIQTQPNPPEAYNFREMLVQEMGQVYGVQGVSRGNPPKGITAAVALQFLNEQEQERANSDVAKHNHLIQAVAEKTLAVCGDYYQIDDGRMLRILGTDNKFALRHFDSANLSKNYDIRIEVGTGLPESKAGRLQRIIEIMQLKPDLLSNERWIDLLDIGNTDKMTNLITAAVRSAESENEDLLAGRAVSDPQDFEDHILHWRTHTKAVQSRAFKEEVPIKEQQAMLEHIALTEFAMIEKAKVNPLFQSHLATLPMFPVYPTGMIPQSKEHMEAIVQGQANRGDQVTGMIPGADSTEQFEDYRNREEK